MSTKVLEKDIIRIPGHMLDHRSYEIPANTLGGIRRWVLDGIPGGGFLSSFLCGDLFGACNNADGGNIRAIGAIAKYLFNEVPSDCYGTPEKVKAWGERLKNAEVIYECEFE